MNENSKGKRVISFVLYNKKFCIYFCCYFSLSRSHSPPVDFYSNAQFIYRFCFYLFTYSTNHIDSKSNSLWKNTLCVCVCACTLFCLFVQWMIDCSTNWVNRAIDTFKQLCNCVINLNFGHTSNVNYASWSAPIVDKM